MTRVLIVCFAAALLASCSKAKVVVQPGSLHSVSDLPLTQAMPLAKARLQGMGDVGGFAGFAISPTPFLKLSVVFIEGGDQPLFDSFIESTNSTVRAMGLACLSQTDSNAFEIAWSKLKNDRHELTVWTGCCLPIRMTLGDLATRLRENPNFLGHADDYWDFQKFRQRVRDGSVPAEVVTPIGQQDGPANGSQPIRSEIISTSPAAGSRR